MLGAFHGVGLTLQLNPAFARGRLDAELVFERLEIARIVVVELLCEAGVLEVEGLSGHVLMRGA